MFLGKEGAGKTSCVKAMLKERFNPDEPSTDGIVTKTVFQANSKSEWKRIEDEHDDAEQTRKMREHALKQRVDKELEDNQSYPIGGDSVNIPNEITSIWDYAGQLDYYITHRFFLTNTASYCVAFNALDNLDEPANARDPAVGPLGMTNLDMNLFWIRSVYEHTVAQHASGNPISIDGRVSIESPPICLVATHMDKLPSWRKSRNRKKVEGMFNEMFDKMEGMKYAAHVDREMYMVDNTVKSHADIKKLKKNIGKYMQAMGMKEFPINWLKFQERLQDIGKTKVCIPYNEASRIGTECGISEKAIIVAITYMNDIGKIMYSNKDEKLRNTIITNLHTMIQMFTTVITVFPPAIKDKEIKRRWKRLEDEGILEEKVLRYLWQNQDEGNFDIFIEVMRVFRLLFEKKTEEEGNREFLVPCRMKVFTNTSLEVTKDDMQMVSIYLTPTDFLPEAVYHTLVVAFLELMTGTDSDDSKVFRNRSDFEFKDHKVSLGAVQIKRENEKPHAIKLQIYRRTEHSFDTEVGGAKPKKRQLQPSVCIEVLSYLRDQLQTVCNIYEGSGYKLRVVCDACNPKEHHLVDLEKCLKNDVVPCGEDTTMNTAHIKRYFSKGNCDESEGAPLCRQRHPSKGVVGASSSNQGNCDESEGVPLSRQSHPSEANQKVNKMADLNEKFKDLKANLSKHYAGDHCRLVKLCLYDHLPLGDFEGRGLTAHNLFNKLQTKGYIEPSNVKLLLEVTKLTEFKVAEHLVLDYIQDNNIKQTQTNIKPMSPYRKRLFAALHQVEGDSLSHVIAYYNLEHFGLTNIWDVVFKLESNEELKDEPGKLEKFASRLNERAKKLLLDRGVVGASSSTTESEPDAKPKQLVPVTESEPD